MQGTLWGKNQYTMNEGGYPQRGRQEQHHPGPANARIQVGNEIPEKQTHGHQNNVTHAKQPGRHHRPWQLNKDKFRVEKLDRMATNILANEALKLITKVYEAVFEGKNRKIVREESRNNNKGLESSNLEIHVEPLNVTEDRIESSKVDDEIEENGNQSDKVETEAPKQDISMNVSEPDKDNKEESHVKIISLDQKNKDGLIKIGRMMNWRRWLLNHHLWILRVQAKEKTTHNLPSTGTDTQTLPFTITHISNIHSMTQYNGWENKI